MTRCVGGDDAMRERGLISKVRRDANEVKLSLLNPVSIVMTIIKQDDLIESIADALQYISYFHPLDFSRAMDKAYQREENPAARDAIAQILINSRMCADGPSPHLPGHRDRECVPEGRHGSALGHGHRD